MKKKDKKILRAVLIFSFLILPAIGRAVQELPPPTINVSPDVFYSLDETLYLEGKASPTVTVELFFEKQSGGPPVRLNVKSNSNGEWFLAQKLELTSGEWMVRGRILSDPPSDWSNPRIIRSVVSGFFIGSIKIKYLPTIIILGSLIIIGLVLLIYSSIRIRKIQHLELERKMAEKTEEFKKALLEKETEVTTALVEENFKDIRRKITEEWIHLEEKLREKGGLSKEEEEHRSRLLRDLRDAEEKIEEKIREIT